MSSKHRSGLHREISSIFDGVPLPKKNGSADGAGVEPEPTDTSAGRVPPPPSEAPKPLQVKTPTQEQPQPQMEAPEIVEAVKKPRHPSKFEKIAREFLDNARTKLLTPPQGVSRRRHLAMVISIPAMFIVVLFVFGRLFLRPGVKGAVVDDTEDFASLSAPKSQIEWQKPAPYPQDLRDPMKEASASATMLVSGDLVVRGIVWSTDNPAAIVGTAILYRGQAVNGATIVQINENSVEFEKDGKRWTQNVEN